MKFPELTYAQETDPPIKRYVIRAIETLAGRDYFAPLYEIWREDVVPSGGPVIAPMLDLIGVELQIASGKLPALMPNDPPLVIVANHPYGILDGIAALTLAEKIGRPFKVLINKDLMKVPEIHPYALPVDFEETRAAQVANIKMRREALELLRGGYTIVVFPAGGVATAREAFGKAEELPWKSFTARMIQSAQASVLPVYFEGQNGWLFHLVSRFSVTLRLSMLISEFRRIVGSTLRVRIGEVVRFEDLNETGDRKVMTAELHDRVMRLADACDLEVGSSN